MDQDIARRVIEIVSRQSGMPAEKIHGDADFTKDLQMDSLTTIETCMEIEDTFGVSIPDEELNAISTVDSAVDLLMRLLNESTAA